jgi:hypothetical protein
MKNKLLIIAGILLAVISLVAYILVMQPFKQRVGAPSSGQLMVTFNDNVTEEMARSVLQKYKLTLVNDTYRINNFQVVSVPYGKEDYYVSMLKTEPAVKSVSIDKLNFINSRYVDLPNM